MAAGVNESAFYVSILVGPFDTADEADAHFAARKAAADCTLPDAIVAMQVLSGMSILFTALEAGLPFN